MNGSIFRVIVLLLFSAFVQAEQVTQQQALSFGTIALRDNNSAHQMSISFNGNINADPAFVIITPGNPAEFLLTNFTANTLVNIAILVPSPTTILANGVDPATSQFTIDSHHSFAPTVTTNLLGEATINIGANLTTSGVGYYKDALYIAPMTISVNY
ncbi:MAG: DUF4402 domain-containing protein [Colwellia sp.]|nr:DUF4402 domain-containing protein [Colwellia sp.]